MPIAPKKHGFYERNCLDFTYRGPILIRRYYCPYCGKTGQPPIRNKLTLSINHLLRQRIVVKHMMSNLQKEELAEYLKSRLIFAGTHEDLFTPPSIEAIYGVTSGVPRLVNSIATNSLLVACEKKAKADR